MQQFVERIVEMFRLELILQLSLATLFGGAIITETIFNWPGLGLWLYNAIFYKDFPVMQALFYIIALSVIAANFISDILYGIVDPRIRYE